MKRSASILVLILFVLTATCRGAPDAAAFVPQHYVKHDYLIPMRDGVRLFTSVYSPRDTSRAYPILMVRTPYSIAPYGRNKFPDTLGPADVFTRRGFIFVYQDVRGRNHSEGTFLDMPPPQLRPSGHTEVDESTDAADSLNWIVKHIANNNGRAGLWGVSYEGFYAAHGMLHASPALAAASPQAPMADEGDGDDSYHNGAFFLAANFGFYTDFWPRHTKHPNIHLDQSDQYDFFLRMGPLANANQLYFKNRNPYWNALLDNTTYAPYWSARALGPVMTNLTAPVLVVGGWDDAEDLGGTVKLFQAIDQHGGAPAVTLVMGPWSHGEWEDEGGEKLGNLHFGSPTSDFFQEQIEFPFFEQWLEPPHSKSVHLPKAWLFETGKNEWQKFDSWPPPKAKLRSLYLQPDSKLSFQAAPAPEGFDEYTSDPAKPVPVIPTLGPGMPGDYMTRDQRFAARRTDVLTYVSEPLEHDLVVAGPVTPVLRVSTSGTDSDFVVKLIDAYPADAPKVKGVHFAGYQQLVRGEPFRGKFRHDLSVPEPFVPGQPVTIKFEMPDVLHDFRKGHRLMVQIQSTWFPMVDLNPQQFENIPTAKAADFQKAVERVYYGGTAGTHLDFLTLE